MEQYAIGLWVTSRRIVIADVTTEFGRLALLIELEDL